VSHRLLRLWKPRSTWRSARKCRCQRSKIEIIFSGKPCLSDQVLLGVVMDAQADAPAIGRFQCDAAIGAGADVGAFDR